MDDQRPNIWSDEWQRTVEHGGFALRGTRVGALAGMTETGMTVYELPPAKRNMPYHAHHAIEETIVVLRGTPTLRTPDGERELAEGEVVVCPRGRAGAHQLINRTGTPARYLVVSSKAPADLVEYPDSDKISAQAGEWGTPDAIAYTLAREPQVDYFAGEPE